MSRTSTRVGMRLRGPAWSTVTALVAVLALALVWGVAPAMADTAPATTPTVAPTTAATVAPTTVKTVAPTTAAVTVAPTATPKVSGSVSVRAYPPGAGDQCATPIAGETATWPTSGVGPCVVELFLATPTIPTGDEGWRVGDVVELTLSVKNRGTSAVTINGVDAFIDFTLAQLELVAGSPVATVTPQAGACDSECDKGAFTLTGGIFASANAADIVENYYYNATVDGRLNLSAGLREAPATVDAGATAIVGTIKFRLKSNPTDTVKSGKDGEFPIVLRNRNQATSGSSGWRNSAVVTPGSIGNAAGNIMGRATDLPLPVERTEVALSIVPTVVAGKDDIRVADVVPVDLKLTATTIVRNMTSLDAAMSFDFAKFVLVDSTGAVIAPDITTATTLNTSGFAFGTGTEAITDGNKHTQATASNVTSTITLKIGGTALTLAKDDVKTVVRFYVKPKDNGATLDTNNEITLGADPILGVRPTGNSSIGYRSYVTTGATDPATGAKGYAVTVKHTKITLALAVATPTDATRGHRTGDTIKIDLTATAADKARNVTTLNTTIQVPKGDFVLVNGPSSGTDSKTFAAAPVLKATSSEALGVTTSGHATFDLTTTATQRPGLITIAFDGEAIDLGTTAKVIGSFYVRPRYNGADVAKDVTLGAANIGIKQANDTNGYTAGNLGFEVEVAGSGTGGAVVGTKGTVTVKRTVVDLKLVPNVPTPLRIGNEVPVAINVVPTDASYVNHLHAEATVTGNDFQVVDTGLTTGVVTSANAFKPSDGTETVTTNTYGSNTITFDVSGKALTAGTSDVKVGDFFIRPRKKALTNPVFASEMNSLVADEKQTGDVATIYGANLFAVDTAPVAANPAVTTALGTLGIGLELRSPTADHPGLDYDGNQWTALAKGATQANALNVVDGRYLDVKVVVDGATTAGDAQKVDVLDIDLTVDSKLTLKSADGFILKASTPEITSTATGGALAVAQSGQNVTLRLASSALISAPTEVARLRFALATTADGAPVDAPVVLKVADTTVLKQKDASGIFIYDNYADPVGTATVGEFDHGPTATRQKPATLQISTLLQGRTPENAAKRFEQILGVELRKTGAPVVRHLTVTTTPESVRVIDLDGTGSGTETGPSTAMQYDRATVKKPNNGDTKFAEAKFKATGTSTDPGALADLEPGTYDVYIKGESSVGVIVTGVAFGAGAEKTIDGLVLREGDLYQSSGSLDKIQAADFTAFSPKWGKVVDQTIIDAAPTDDAIPLLRQDTSAQAKLADLNRSGYVDIFDFSLLASNYDLTGPVSVATGGDAGLGSGTVSVARTGGTSTAALDVNVGAASGNGVVPVTIAVAPGSRAVDGVQVVLKTAPGVTIVNGDAAAFNPAEANPMPVILSQAWDAAKGLVNLALGRAPATGGLTAPATLGTINVRVPAGFTGSPVTIERADGPFATSVVGAGVDLTGTLDITVAGATSSISTGVGAVDEPASSTVVVGGTEPAPVVSAPVVPAPVVSAPVVSAPVVSAPVVEAPASLPSANLAVAPAPAITPVRAASPAPAPAARLAVTAPIRSPFAPVMIENRTKGTLTLVRPGSGTVELKTGLTTTTPDAYCPVARHKTYIRLEDTGIAGATFGVETGGVLSWVTPDQAGCVDWNAISEGGLTFTKETIMQFQLARAVPGALLWVLDGNRHGELYEVDAQGVANYVTADAFAANQDHFTEVWANVIPVSTSQIEGLTARGSVNR